MILVDTSVWVDHLQHRNERLVERLGQAQILGHPFVIGELALGGLKQKSRVLMALQGLPASTMATDAEVLAFIDRQKLSGTGIGYVDTHLLVACRLTPGTLLWTLDKRLNATAHELGLAFARAH